MGVIIIKYMNTRQVWVALVYVVSLAHSLSRTHPLSGMTMQKSLTLKDVHGSVLENLRITSRTGPCLTIRSSSELLLRNLSIGPCRGVGIRIEHSEGVTIETSLIRSSTSSMYAIKSTGISVRDAVSKNATGSKPRGQCFQSNDCDGPITIDNLTCLQSSDLDPEDGVNFYKTRGTPKNPVVIKNSFFRGGGPSRSGCGILLGDDDGSYQYAINNYLEDPGQCGIGVSGGSHNIVQGNVVYAANALGWNNVGIYAWDQHDSQCRNITIRDNTVYYVNKKGILNNRWFAPNCAVSLEGNEWLGKDPGKEEMLFKWSDNIPEEEEEEERKEKMFMCSCVEV